MNVAHFNYSAINLNLIKTYDEQKIYGIFIDVEKKTNKN